jgi:hypothetical protein
MNRRECRESDQFQELGARSANQLVPSAEIRSARKTGIQFSHPAREQVERFDAATIGFSGRGGSSFSKHEGRYLPRWQGRRTGTQHQLGAFLRVPALEHIPLKSIRFERNMLQLLNLERFLVDRVTPPGGQAL